jgi:hypothetical protein
MGTGMPHEQDSDVFGWLSFCSSLAVFQHSVQAHHMSEAWVDPYLFQPSFTNIRLAQALQVSETRVGQYLFQPSCFSTRYKHATNSRSWYIMPIRSQGSHRNSSSFSDLNISVNKSFFFKIIFKWGWICLEEASRWRKNTHKQKSVRLTFVYILMIN